jgi:23S rRNA pseudouridine2457 synthase
MDKFFGRSGVLQRMARLVLFNKPYGVQTQFRSVPGEGRTSPTLADFIPLAGVYPAGRLDKDSEGLLLLTDDGRLQHRISHPRHKLWKTYWVQVEGIPDADALAALAAGVRLSDGLTLPAKAASLVPPTLWPRDPPVRYRANIPTAWVEVRIREGRNRQVRRMTAAVGLPTLRLVRAAVGDWHLGGLGPGEWRMLEVEVPPLAPPPPSRQAARRARQ